ncbi:accessory Sec-dependent serine-rich glycoprotein adhesin [Streptococcus parasanguinis]|uniref:accessory Sec-dependent serine-rich glycoprotein adhesin n=1 Tax=Streptococcus parasanguinis TaxID=1318 RepID=UPI0026758EC4|nr:accessory Sec-dependent serine-rich glycoprotein adhesin [Streptococcus parasanguinis]
MQFKRSKGNFRETDRVVRFKLIKSGKNWLRASTAALGLFRVVRGQVEETIIANVQQDQIESQKNNQAFLKGLITVGTVFGGAVLATTAKAEDATSLAPTVSETKEETLVEVDSVVLAKTSSQPSESISVSGSTSFSTSESASASISESTSLSLSEVGSTALSTALSESAQALESEVVVEEPTSLEEATVLEQNTSEAELLQEIAGNYASKMTDTDRRAVVEAVINKVQAEVAASNNLIHTNASAQAYADQRDRLEKAVDEMMTTLTAAGFVGNTNVDGKPAISAQLAPLAEETYLADDVLDMSPNPEDPNGASVEDPTLDTPGYAKDPHLDKDLLRFSPEELKNFLGEPYTNRYTFGIWDFVNKQGESLGYYATMSIDISEIDPEKHKAMDVYFRIVRKSDGAEIFSQTVSPEGYGQDIQLPKEVLIGQAPLGNKVFNSEPSTGNGTFGMLTNFIPEQAFLFRSIYDVMTPENQGQLIRTYPSIKIPSMMGQQSTFYREVDPNGRWFNGQYEPTGKERSLLEYRIYGLEGQHYTASNPREFPGYVQVPAHTVFPNRKSGVFDNSKNGKSRIELLGDAREHFIKSEVVTLNQNGDYSLRYYVLDPSKIHDVSSGDVGNAKVTDVYTLVYEKEFKQDSTDNLSDLGGTRKVESKNKDYFLNVTPKRIDYQHFELDITGWFSSKETVTYTDEKTGIEYTVPKPFTELPKSAYLDKNTTMVVGEDATPQGADGFSNFKQTIKKIVDSYPLTSVNYYYRKMTPSESASQSQNFSISTSESLVSESISSSQSVSVSESVSLSQASSFASQSDSQVSTSISLSQSVSTSESNSLVQESISTSQSESLVQESVSASQSDSLIKESVSASQSDSLVQASVSASQSDSLVQASVSASQSESLLKESVSSSQSDSLVQESVSASQSESLVQASVSESESELLLQESVSASQSESLVQESVSASQSESLVQESVSASQSDSQVQESVSASQSDSLIQESVSASQSDSLVQESVSSSQSESLVKATVSASQSESLVQESVSASQSESLVQESVSASQSESLVQESVSASQSESLVQASVSASQSDSQVQALVSVSQSESLVQESVSASRSDSLAQTSVSSSQSESLVQASVSASQSESLVQESVSVSQSQSTSDVESKSQNTESMSFSRSDSMSQSESQVSTDLQSTSWSQSESQVQASIFASQSESLVQESVSASQSKSLVQASTSASQSESQVQASVSASQSESLIQASISNSYSESLVQASVSASQSDSLVQASASTSESASTSHVVAASQVSESGSFSRSVSESLSASQWTSHSGSLASASLSKSDSYSQSASLLSTSESASTSMPVSEFPLTSVSDSISASSTESQSLSQEISEWISVSYASSFSAVTSSSESVVSSFGTSYSESPSDTSSLSATRSSEPALPETGAHPSSNILATGASILLSGLALLGIRKKDGK